MSMAAYLSHTEFNPHLASGFNVNFIFTHLGHKLLKANKDN